MMKHLSKTIKISVFLIIVASLILPNLSLAISDSAQQKIQQKICDWISQAKNRVEQRTQNRADNIDLRRTQRSENLSQSRQNRDKNLSEIRNKWNDNRDAIYQKLEEKVDTDTKKQALIKFQQQVETAVITRKTTIDKAIQDYRAGIDQAITKRKTDTDQAVNTYRISIQTAFQNALNSCEQQTPTNQIRTDLQNAIKAVRDKFNQDKQNIEKVSDSVQSLIDARRKVIEKAVDDFKTALEKAKQELKTAWGETSSSATSTNQ